MGRRVAVVAVVVVQLALVARGYWADHKEFAFQMFPESSTWRADVVRVTADGRRLPVEAGWAGYRWDELVQDRGLRYPAVRHHADAGLDNQIAFLDAALDWVAAEHASRPRDPLPRGEGHGLAQRRPGADRGPAQPRPRGRAVIARFDELLGRRVSMRALALLRVFAGPVVLLHLRPFLSDAADGHIYSDAFYEPYASWYPELPGDVYVGAAVARGACGRLHDARAAHPPGNHRRRSRSSPTTSSCRPRTSTTTGPTS